MEKRHYVALLIGTAALATLASTSPTDKVQFMLKILGSAEIEADQQTGYKTNDTKEFENEQDVSKNSSSVDGEVNDNATKSASDSEPAFGEGVGSNWHGGFSQRRGRNNGHLGLGGGFGQYLGGLRPGGFVDGYVGFGSPEMDGGGFIRQRGKGQRRGGQGLEGIDRGKGTNTRQIGSYVDGNLGGRRNPHGHQGLPGPNGCLCDGTNPSDPCCSGRSPRGSHEEVRRINRNRGQFGGGLHGLGGGPWVNGQHGGQHQMGGYHGELFGEGQFGGGQGINGHRGGQIIGNFNGGHSNHQQAITPKLPPAIGIEYVGPFKCPVVNGNFPHPTECSHFLQCAHSIPYETPCPSGLLYDSNVGMCNWPDLVRCNSPTGTEFANQIFNATLIIPSTWKVPWNKCRSMEVAVNAVFISVAQAVIGKPCPNSECQFPYVVVNCLK